MRSRQTDALVGNRLRQERLLAGYTVDDLAAFLGIGSGLLRRYETGQQPLEASRLAAAALLLDVPLSFFCYEIDRPLPHRTDDRADRARWVALPRPWSALSRPDFRPVQPLVKLWTETRGARSDEIDAALRAGGIRHRAYLLRQTPHASRLIVESFASGVAFLKPCESLLMTGREMHDMPDGDYGAWTAETYAEAARDGRPRLQSVRADIRTSSAATVRGRYDRILLPLRGPGSERSIIGISLRREICLLS